MADTLAITGPLRGPLRKRESNLWKREINDHYVETEWCSQRLFESVRFTGNIIDPACGFGNILKSAKSAGLDAFGYDIVSRSPLCQQQQDFMSRDWETGVRVDNIVSNPPFGICDTKKGKAGFVDLALERVGCVCALLLPANWVQGDTRSRWLATTPLRKVLFITPRPSMPPGHVLAGGGKPGNGTTDYAWFIWLKGFDGSPEVGWLRRSPT